MPASPSRIQKLLLIGFGVALVLMAEGVLRLAGLGGEPPLLVPFGEPRESGPDAGRQLYEVNPAIGEIFFSRRGPTGGLVGGHRRELLALPKPEGLLRVLYLGASTVEGFPMPRNLTSARFLEEMLRETIPDHEVEVLNLGVAAIASFPVRKIAEQAIAQCDPDLVLVYAGHNEFFGAGGVASFQFMGRSATVRELTYALRKSALFQAAGLLVSPRTDGDEGNPERSLISAMAAVREIEPNGELHTAARASLERNLRAIVEAAHRADVPIAVSTLVSNERGLFPIASWTQGVDGLSAELRYREALALRDSGQPDAADAAFRRARDLDAMPWRAPRALNEVLRGVVRETGATLADAQAAFSRTSDGANGWRLFVDHVHPSLEGQFVLARTLFQAIAAERLLPIARPRAEGWRSLSARLGAHALEHYVLVHKMRTLFERPPIGSNNGEAAERFARLLTRIEEAADPVEAAALVSWKQASADAGFALPVSFLAGAKALRLGRPDRALPYLRAAIEGSFPYSDERCAAQLLLALAETIHSGPPAALEDYRAEAAWVASLPGQPSPLLTRTLELYAALAGEPPSGESGSAAAQEIPPWMATYLRELPEAEAVRELGRAAPPVRGAEIPRP